MRENSRSVWSVKRQRFNTSGVTFQNKTLVNGSVDYKMNSIYLSLSLSFPIHRMFTLIKDAVATCCGVIYHRTSDRFTCLLTLIVKGPFRHQL